MLKLISLVLSFSLIFTSVAPSYAAGVSAQRQNEALREQIEHAVNEAQEAQEEAYGNQIKLIFEQVNALINPASAYNPNYRGAQIFSGKAQTAGDVLTFCDVKLNALREEYKKAGKTGNEYLEQGYVCTQRGSGENAEQICSNAAAFAQVCASVALDKRWDGKGSLKAQNYSQLTYDVKKEKNVGKTISGFAYRPTEQIFNVKIEGDDITLVKWLGDYWIINNEDKAVNYLIQLLHIPNVCTKADDKNDMFEQRSSECELALKSMELLTGVTQIYPNYKVKVADEVFAFMKNKNREALASGPVLQGTLALMALNTDKSYALLTQFLDKETNASFWQKLGEISVEGIVSASASIGSKREYYNNAYTLGFNYMDPVLLKSWYGKENFKSPLMQAFTGEDRVKMVHEGKDFSDDVGTYQFPYGNLFEDIGVLIAKDAQKNPRSARLAKTIFQDAIDARERKIDADTHSNHVLQYPTPLFAGVLLGGYGEQEGRKELKRLADTNFIDMNEGTQRRFRMNIDKALKTPAETQKIDNDEAAYAAFVAQYTQRDEAKYKDHTALVIAKRVGFGADLIIIAFFAARIVTGIVKWVGSLGSVLAKSVQGLRSFATKGFSKIGKNFNTIANSSKRLAFRSKAGVSATAAGTASTGAATAAKAGTAVSTTQKGAATAQKVTQTAQSAAKTTQTTGAVTKAASAPANAGKTGLLTIDANGIPQIKPLESKVVPSAATAQNGLKLSRSMTAAVGDGTAGTSGATGLTYKQASSRLKAIKNEVKGFKGTPLEGKFNNALNKYLAEARAANQAAGKSSSLGLMDRLAAHEKALSEATAGVEYLETSALGATRVSPQVAATAFTMNNEITGMQKAAAAAGHTPRIYTDKDVLRVLPRAILGDISREIKTLGQSFFMTAKRPEGWGALAALTGVVPTTSTGSAIEAARIFAETSRPAIVLIADTKHAGTLAPRILSARKVPMMATKPIQMPISKLPVMRRAWMSFEDAYKVLTPVFMNMGLTTYDEIFSDEVMAKVAKANPEAYASFYTYDVTAERALFNARSSGNAIKYTVPTEIAAPAPTNVTQVVSLETKQAVRAAFPIDVTNQAQVSNFSARVMSKFTPSAIAAMDLTGGLATSLTKLAAKKKYNKYKTTIENYLSQAVEIAETAKAADASLTAEAAILAGVNEVLSKDTTLPEAIKESFVEEVIAAVDGKSVSPDTTKSSFEVENFEDLVVTDVNAEQVAAALPLQAKKGTLFRGMALSADGVSLSQIFAEGLLLKNVTANAGTLITSMAGGMGFGGVRAARQASKVINLTNSPQAAAKWGARFNDPSKRLIVVTQVDGLNAANKDTVTYANNIAPENVSAVYVLLDVDGKATWCLVEPTENGKFKVTPVADSGSSIGSSGPSDPNGNSGSTGTPEELLKNKRFGKIVLAVQDETNKAFIAQAKDAVKNNGKIPGQEAYQQSFKSYLQAAVKKDPRMAKFADMDADVLYATAQSILNKQQERTITFNLQLRDAEGKVLPVTFPLVINLLDKTAVKQFAKLDVTDSESFTLRQKNGVFELMITTPGGGERGIYQPFIQGGKAEAEALYYQLFGDYKAGKFAKGTPEVSLNLYSDVHAERATLFAGLTEGLGGLPQATVAPFATALNVSDPKQMQSSVSHSQLGNVASVIFSGLQKAFGIKNTLALGLGVAAAGLGICAAALTLPTLAQTIAGLGVGSFVLGIGANGGVKSTNSIYAKELSNDNTTGTARMGFVNARASIGTMTGYLFFPASVLFAITGVTAFQYLYLGAMVVPAYALFNLMLSKVRNVGQMDSSVQGAWPVLKETAKAVGNVFVNIGKNVWFALTGGFKERATALEAQRVSKANEAQYKKMNEGELKAEDFTAQSVPSQASFGQKVQQFVKIGVPAFLSQYLLKMMLVVALYHFAGMMFNSGPGAIIGSWIKSEAGQGLVAAAQNLPVGGLAVGAAAAGFVVGAVANKVVNKLLKKDAAEADAEAATESKAITLLKKNAVPLATAAVAAGVTLAFPSVAGAVGTVLSRVDATALAQLLTFFTAYVGVWAGRQYLSGFVKSGKLTPQGIIGASGTWSLLTTGLAFIPGLPLGVRAVLWGLAGLGFANLAGFENSLAMEKYPNQKPAVNMAYTLARLSGAATVFYGSLTTVFKDSAVDFVAAAPDVYALILPAGALALATFINRKYIGNFRDDVRRWRNLPPELSYGALRTAADAKYRGFIENGEKFTEYDRDVEEVATNLFNKTSHKLTTIEKLLDAIESKLIINSVRLETIAVLRELLNGQEKNAASLNATPLTYSVFTRQEVHPLIQSLTSAQKLDPQAREDIIRSAATTINNRYYITTDILHEIESGVKRRQEGLDGFRADVLREMYKMKLTQVATIRAARYAGSKDRYNQSMSELENMAQKVLGPENNWKAPAYQKAASAKKGTSGK